VSDFVLVEEDICYRLRDGELQDAPLSVDGKVPLQTSSDWAPIDFDRIGDQEANHLRKIQTTLENFQ
jgi:hypothetical protein